MTRSDQHPSTHHPSTHHPSPDHPSPDAARLGELIGAQHAAISIVTPDEPDAEGAVAQACVALGLPLSTWSILDGLRGAKDPARPLPDTDSPLQALITARTLDAPGVVLLRDMGAHLSDARTLRAWRDLVAHARTQRCAVVMVDHEACAIPLVSELSTEHRVSLPAGEEIESIVREELRAVHRDTPIEIDMTRADFGVIIKNLGGLSRRHVRAIVREVVALDRRFNREDLNHVLALKRALLSGDGVLEPVESPATLDEVGGLSHLKAWLKQRERSFDSEAADFGLSPPRGVLLLGVQGAGKSLCAKAIATAWGRPLLRLDPGSLYDRYVGESERRLRSALEQAEAMAPMVLWSDEIEKGFASAASQSTDGGLSQRMFGTLLTWMQDHRSPVFLVATANNIDALPPELLRKGRFDEIFFVDLPGEEARRMIASIHLGRRSQDAGAFDLDAIARATEGYSGAEIEQAVIAALHRAFSERVAPTTAMIVEAAEASPPLSVTMRERIASLRAWASERCVPAG